MFGLSDTARSSRMLAFVLAVILLNRPAPVVFALITTPGSPCTDVCGTTTNTTSSEIACLDQSYNKTTVGENFKKCVSCQLDSEFNDASTGESDVNWGLYNLRYAFSTCVFGVPDSISNVSSPCPVACDGVRVAVETDIRDPDTSNLDDWCDAPSFADNVVNTCEFCYNLTTTQVYMANCTYALQTIPVYNISRSQAQRFKKETTTDHPPNPVLESIRYNCHFKTVTGNAFDIAPTRIFTQSLLPSSLSLTTPTASSSNLNLGLVIAVPIVGFLLILASLAICCFFFIRHRRKKTNRTRQSPHVFNQWNNGSPISAQQQQQAWAEQQMYNSGYGHGLGFGFMDNDGRGQELAYAHAQDQQYQNQQYQQQFTGQDKSGFAQDIIEQPVDQQHQQQHAQQQYEQQHAQVPVHTQNLDPDHKDPQQWQ
ncbi:unnamed protein product [Penicillium glandicola]